MIHDLFLEKMRSSNSDKKCEELARLKKEFYKNRENENLIFDHDIDGIKELEKYTTLIKFKFILRKPFMSRDEDSYRLLVWNNRRQYEKITENPVTIDKLTGRPTIYPSTWKGNLRFAAQKIEGSNNKNTIRRLFGSDPKSNETSKGRLYFYPTFFDKSPEREIVTPLSRSSRTPIRSIGPINIEVVKEGSEGIFSIIYFPYSKEDEKAKETIEDDLKFLCKAIKEMFLTYGFSAKKSSGYGVSKDEVSESVLFINGVSTTNTSFRKISELESKVKELMISE